MKRIAVIIRAQGAPRVAEALRAAVGLCLRGDRVEVVLDARAGRDHPQAQRAIATLRMLGHQVVDTGDVDAAATRVVRAADAVEVWT